MKFCPSHWASLRAAIDERGLSHLVAKGGAQAVRNLAAEHRDGPSIQTFDPLMTAHNAIFARALDVAGLAIMVPNEDGTDKCPQCFLNSEHERSCTGPPCVLPLKTAFDHWTGKAADMARLAYDELVAQARPDA